MLFILSNLITATYKGPCVLLFLSLQRGRNKRPNAYYLCNDAYTGLLLFAALALARKALMLAWGCHCIAGVRACIRELSCH